MKRLGSKHRLGGGRDTLILTTDGAGKRRMTMSPRKEGGQREETSMMMMKTQNLGEAEAANRKLDTQLPGELAAVRHRLVKKTTTIAHAVCCKEKTSEDAGTIQGTDCCQPLLEINSLQQAVA